MADDESKGTSATAGTNSQAYEQFVAALMEKGQDVADFQPLSNDTFQEVMKDLNVKSWERGVVLKDFRKNFPLLTNTGTQLSVHPFTLRCHALLFPVCPFRSLCPPVCFVAGGARPVAPSFRLSCAAFLCGALCSALSLALARPGPARAGTYVCPFRPLPLYSFC